MTTTITQHDDVNSIRFRLLADLSHALGLYGCSSQLINPARGGAVLYVDRRGQPGERLGVGAVEHSPDWVYAWDGHWCPVRDLRRIVEQIARTVST